MSARAGFPAVKPVLAWAGIVTNLFVPGLGTGMIALSETGTGVLLLWGLSEFIFVMIFGGFIITWCVDRPSNSPAVPCGVFGVF